VSFLLCGKAGRQDMTKIDPIVWTIMKKRGISTREDAIEFLSPKPKRTYDPFLLKDMEEGVQLILDTVNEGGRICVYGDYDTDGITSTCVMMTILSQLSDKVTYYIPSRFEEGYGLNKEAIAEIREQGTDLMITVDCGSSSRDEVEFAKEIGLRVLVTDHHSIDDVQADCLLINPKQRECNYPFDGLAGCGVAYKVAQALQRRADLPKSVIARLLDIVAIGTIGDIVPLVDENRTIVKYGLRELNSGNRLSLKKFCEGVSLKPGSIGSAEVTFIIVPHLNAAGRMKSADYGVKLLLSEDKNEIMLLTEMLKGYNNKRKEIQQETYEMCLELMKEQCAGSLFPVIEAEEAHEGITGIVAGKIKDREKKPVIIVTPSDGMLKGTGRCIENLNLYDIMKKHAELFIRFGGHAGACGFTMEPKNLDKLRKCLHEDLAKMDPALLEPPADFDLDINAGNAGVPLAEQLEILAPFGNCNRRPVFRFRGLHPDDVRLMGNNNQHLRFRGSDASGSVNCVLFGRAGDFAAALQSGSPVNVYGELSINEWNGSRNLQVLVREMTAVK
jgi:single-stranded-DNA-specific exonuclease